MPTSYFWKEIPHNTLGMHSYGSEKSLKYTRIFGILFSAACTIFTIVNERSQYYLTYSYLTNIGVYFCLIYFSLIFVVKNDPDSGRRWKWIYALCEVVTALETLIAPFWWIVIFKPYKANANFIAQGICMHFGLTVLMWAETIQNQVSFEKSHRIFLGIVGVIYIIDNIIYSFANRPVYSVITWKNWQTYVYVVVAIIVAFAGFEIGRCQYNKKMSKLKLSVPTRAKGESTSEIRSLENLTKQP